VLAEQFAERRPQPRERAVEAGREVPVPVLLDPRGNAGAERELALVVLPLDPVGRRVVTSGIGVGEAEQVVDMRPQVGTDRTRRDLSRGEVVQELRNPPGKGVQLGARGGLGGLVVLADRPGVRDQSLLLRFPELKSLVRSSELRDRALTAACVKSGSPRSRLRVTRMPTNTS
jgi:hypothetical protein